MIAGKKYQGLQTDIWSSGVILYAMVCGYLPFEDPKTSNLYKKILNADYTFPKFISADAKDLVSKILNTDPEDRINLAGIRGHTWWKLAKPTEREKGLYPGIQRMPFNDALLTQILADYGFDKEYSIKCIESNRHNHITATYHLINKKMKKT